MFNLGWGELVVLAFLGFLILGPERLPQYAAEAARMLRQLRTMARDARTELSAELGTDLPDLRALNPRRAIREHLLGDDLAGNDPLGLRAPAPDAAVRGPGAAVTSPLGPEERPPYDADAT